MASRKFTVYDPTNSPICQIMRSGTCNPERMSDYVKPGEVLLVGQTGRPNHDYVDDSDPAAPIVTPI